MKRNLLFLFLLVLIICSACNIDKKSLLKDNICDPPCWYGISPGESTVDETLIVLSQIPEVKDIQTEVFNLGTSTYVEGISFVLSGSKESSGYVRIKDNVVEFIQISAAKWSISDLFSLYGEPDSYISIAQKIETTNRISFLLYPSEGIVVMIQLNDWNKNNGYSIISGNLPISVVAFFPKGFKSSQMINFFGEIDEKNIHPWLGFGEMITFQSSN